MNDTVAQRGKAPITDTRKSACALLAGTGVGAVQLRDTFWAPRMELNRERTIPAQLDHIEATGRLENFRRAAGKSDAPFQGMHFNDSDVHKWLEAAAWASVGDPQGPTAALARRVASEICAAQQPDGYLHTYFMFERASERWANTRFMHELYVAGHFMQAAVACARAGVSTEPLAAAERLAEHICVVFGPADEGKREETDGHPEIEMALVELGRAAGNRRWIRQAQFFLNARVGQGRMNTAEYPLLPYAEYREMHGHAVCGVYLNAGAADVFAETGDPALRAAIDAMWSDMVGRKLYITGGIGSRWENEAFGASWHLPNERAYTETCAAIGSVMWNWRMLQLDGDARYADLLERTLYNGVLSGISLDGSAYFYQNPLADGGLHRREPWFGCACCPPNVARLIAQLPGYFCSTGGGAIWFHLYARSQARVAVEGAVVTIDQHTAYPWDGAIDIELRSDYGGDLCLRIPGWCTRATVEVNGSQRDCPAEPGSYARVAGPWRRGDVVSLALDMQPRLLEAHPYALENTDRVAMMRGPLLYCLEGVDNPDVDLRDIRLGAIGGVSGAPGLPAHVRAIEAVGTVEPVPEVFNDRTFAPVGTAVSLPARPISLRAIPYYAWANREAGQMQVWLKRPRGTAQGVIAPAVPHFDRPERLLQRDDKPT